MKDRAAELLPVPYVHIVFTLPAAIGDIAYQNKAVIVARQSGCDREGRHPKPSTLSGMA